MNTTVEKWASVPGWGGKYEISDMGKVRVLEHCVQRSDGKFQTFRSRAVPTRMSGPYLCVTLNYSGKSSRVRLHRLLAQVFLPNPEGLPVVRHLNDNPVDNRLENLAWGTCRENLLDAVRNGRNAQAAQTHCKRGHLLAGVNLVAGASHYRVCRACLNTALLCDRCGHTYTRANGSRHRKTMRHLKAMGAA